MLFASILFLAFVSDPFSSVKDIIVILVFFQFVKIFLGAMCILFHAGQKNFDKRLGLFWDGPYFAQEREIRRSWRCRDLSNLAYIKRVLLKEEVHKTGRYSYVEYHVYLEGLEYTVPKPIFTDKQYERAQMVAGQIAKFLSLPLDEEAKKVRECEISHIQEEYPHC